MLAGGSVSEVDQTSRDRALSLRGGGKLRVAYTFISMPVGGAEDFAAVVSRYLPAPFDPVFLCLRDLGPMGQELRESGREVHLLPVAPSKRWNLAGIVRLARWFREEKIGLVHSQTYNSHTYVIPAAHLAGVGCLLHQQKTFERLKPHRMLMMRLLARSSNRIAALSERTRRDMVRAFHLRAERTVVVPNVIDPAEFFPSYDRAAERSHMGIARDAFLIGSIGSLNAVKNHPLTLHMLAALRDQGFSFSGYFFGEGKERAFLESMRNRLRLDGLVLMPGNKRPIAPWMRVLDLVIHPSQAEGQPLTLLQAIACRVPIIASRIEGNVAVLGDQHPGLFDPNSLYEYQALVSRSIREKKFRNTLLAAQERLLRDLPDAPSVARELGRIYMEISTG